MKELRIFLPIVGAIDARRSVGGIKSDTKSGSKRPTTNVQDPRGLVWKDNCTRAEYVCLDMHLTPSSIEVRDKAEVEFVSTSGVGKLRRAAFLEEGDFSVDTDSGKQWRYKSGHEILRWLKAIQHSAWYTFAEVHTS
jgi:hypothetical protein